MKKFLPLDRSRILEKGTGSGALTYTIPPKQSLMSGLKETGSKSDNIAISVREERAGIVSMDWMVRWPSRGSFGVISGGIGAGRSVNGNKP